jgi:hypothetical protein
MNLNRTTTSRALVGQGLLVAGAGLLHAPIIAGLVGLTVWGVKIVSQASGSSEGAR